MKLKHSNIIVQSLLCFFLTLLLSPLSISLAAFTAADPTDHTAPAVGISSPVDGGEITAPTDVIGTVYDAGLSDYRLEYSRRGENDWTALATGSASATNAILGRFDPTLLKNGLYDLRLSAEDFNGNQAAFTRTFLVEGELKVGINKVAFTDLEIPVSGINLSVVRAYDSGDKRDKDFGHGWSLAIGDVALQENRTPGDDWYEVNVGSFLPRWEIRSDKAHMVAVTYPDGKTEAFDLKAEYTDPVFRTGSEVRLKYVPRYGTNSTLEALDLDFIFFNGNKLEDLDAGRAVNPARYRLKKRDGTILTINETDGLERIDEPNGNRVEIDAGGITHSTGKNIVFLRDTHNRIDRIVGPDGHELVYDYDPNGGDLVAFHNALGQTSTYTYDDAHNLTEIHDPRGVRALKAEYDQQGRLIATIDANGNRIAMDHDLATYTSLITDRRGFQTLYTYDEQGRVLSQRDHQGATTSYTYDDRGNKLTETDPLGRTTTYTYDAHDNVLSETDPLGNRTEYTYNARDQILTVTDPIGRVTVSEYDARGNIIKVTDPLNQSIVSAYDTAGRPKTMTDPAGNTIAYQYDAYGNMIRQTDPLGHSVTYTYDTNGNRLTETTYRTGDSGLIFLVTRTEYNANGDPVKVTDPDGHEIRIEYNAAGLKSAEIDKLGRRTEFHYDDAGNLIRTVFADGLEATAAYDEEGNQVSSTDRAGRVTTYEYDHLGRQTRTIYPDGASTRTEYDAAGQVAATVDERGNRTTYAYDDAGRRTSVTDPLGHTTLFAYDDAGNQTAVTDANGHTTNFEYDPLNRLVKTIFTDGTFATTTYDAADCAVDEIGEVEINGVPAEQFDGLQIETRLGALDQTPIQLFSQVRSDTAVGIKLSTDWTYRTTSGNTVQGLGFGILCPRGLYYVTPDGLDGVGIYLHLEYRRVGDAEWTRIQTYNSAPVTVPSDEGRWSGGFWGYLYGEWGGPRTWFEYEQGSTDPAEHIAGQRYLSSFYGIFDAIDPIGKNGVARMTLEWRWIADEIVYQIGELAYNYVYINGATQSALRRAFYRDNLPTAGQIELRVRLASAPPTGPRYGSDVYWDYFQEIVYDDFSYPGRSLLAVRALATDKLSGGRPRVTCKVRRDTVEIDGVSRSAYSPAWASVDALTNADYGGGISVARAIQAAFADWGAWCVTKNFRFDGYFETTGGLDRALATLGQMGRGSTVQLGSKYTCVVDRPAAAVVDRFLFTEGNTEAGFKLDWLPHEDRANAIEVTYFDADFNNERRTVPVFAHNFDTTSQPVVTAQLTLIGCNSRQRAIQEGRFRLNQNRYLTLTGSWSSGIEAISCLPGDVVDVAKDRPGWGASGRIVAATAGTVTLDRNVTLYPGSSYVVAIKRAADDLREYVDVVTPLIETETDTLDISGAWTHGTPERFDNYSFGEPNRVWKQLSILSISRTPDHRIRISGLEYVPEVYGDSATIPASEIESYLPSVTGLQVEERWVRNPDGGGRSVLDLSWRGFAYVWYVFYRQSGGAWVQIGEARRGSFRFDQVSLTIGQKYELAVSPDTAPDHGQSRVVTILGKLAPPDDVENFQAWQDGDEIVFAWDHCLDFDVWGYEIRRGASWAAGETIVDGVQENRARWRPPLSGTYDFWIKSMDQSEIYSTDPAHVQITVEVTGLNIVLDNEEVPTGAASGTLNEYLYFDETLGSERFFWIPGASLGDFPAAETLGGMADKLVGGGDGVYTSQVYDLGQVASVTLLIEDSWTATARAATLGTYPARDIGDYPRDTLGSVTGEAVLVLEYRLSDDGATWSDWAVYLSGAVCSCRYFQLRATTDADTERTFFEIGSIRSIIDVPEKEVRFYAQSVGAAGEAFALEADLGIQILSEYHVGVTVLGSAARTHTVVKAADSFTVYIYNSAGTGVAGSVDLIVRGF